MHISDVSHSQTPRLRVLLSRKDYGKLVALLYYNIIITSKRRYRYRYEAAELVQADFRREGQYTLKGVTK